MMRTILKSWKVMMVWVMVFCILMNTFGRFIPIYFIDPKASEYFGRILFVLTLVSVALSTYVKCFEKEKDNWRVAGSMSLGLTFVTYVVLGFITFFDGFSSFTDVEVLYVRKDDPDTKIFKQYVDSGALGDGYIAVIRKDITSFLKYEKVIDTNTINKNEWMKQ